MRSLDLNSAQLAQFINAPPHVFMRCSTPELNVVALVSILLFVISTLLLLALVHTFSLAVGAGALLAFLVFYVTVRVLSELKKAKPDGYYLLLILKWRAQLRLNPYLVVHTGVWGVGRTLSVKRRL